MFARQNKVSNIEYFLSDLLTEAHKYSYIVKWIFFNQKSVLLSEFDTVSTKIARSKYIWRSVFPLNTPNLYLLVNDWRVDMNRLCLYQIEETYCPKSKLLL